MRQLNIFCEGPTEQGFCVQVLQPHLFPNGDGIIHTLAVGEKDHHHVYGLGRRTKYPRVQKFILNTIKQGAGKNVHFTTLFDLYALLDDFPGKDQNTLNHADPYPYVQALEAAFAQSIDYYRFIPYIQLYEYETLLFADPNAFGISFENIAAAVAQLQQIAVSAASLEHINDGEDTAPSKRIIEAIPEYKGRKASAGPDIAEYIGLANIRLQCRHFNQWLTQLEGLDWEPE